MADLSEIQASGSTKIVGSDSNGLEQTPVQSTTNGSLHINLRNSAGTEITTLPVSAVSLPLPTGAATESTLSALNTKVTTVNTGAVTVSTALPTGANSIGQVTANAGTNLNTSALALEATQATQNIRIGDLAETAPIDDTTSSGLNGRLQRIAQRITSLISIFNPLSATPLLTASALAVRVIPYEPATYSAAAVGFVPAAATATDIFTITGSATKTIRIKEIRISGTTTSGSPIKTNIQIIKRSSANVGGTSAVVTPAQNDSASAASTATVVRYTVNPTTLGTIVAAIRGDSTAVSASGISGGVIMFDFSKNPVILNGTTQLLCINLGGASVTSPVFSISVEWAEV